MARSRLIETHTPSLGALFTNGRVYAVPPYQRDYSWTEAHWEELWEDIVNAHTSDDRHYMGTIVLQVTGEKSYDVIDGQQRLATLSLLILAAIAELSALSAGGIDGESNKERSALLGERYVRLRDATSLNYQSRLNLNRDNNGFYQSYLAQLKAPPAPARLPESEKLLYGAFCFFRDRLKERFGASPDGAALTTFIDRDVADRLIFIQVLVEDDLRAYTLFETLNARGLELSVTDLLKNYLFSLCADSETDLRIVGEHWARIIARCGLKEFPLMLRHYWNSSQPYVREQYLFKTVRNQVKSKEDAFRLLESLEKVSILHSALQDPEDSLWEGDSDTRQSIDELNLFRVTQCNPLIFAAHARFDTAEFKRILKICVTLSFRYTVIGRLNPQPLERAYNQAAISVSSGESAGAKQAFAKLKPVYVDDEQFQQGVGTFSVHGNRNDLTRYILCKLETLQSGKVEDFRSSAATVEHILPENPASEWDADFNREIQGAYIYRLGNLTLLEREKNRQVGNAPFSEKLNAYQTSRYKLTNTISATIWTQVSVAERQRTLARWAPGIWKIDY